MNLNSLVQVGETFELDDLAIENLNSLANLKSIGGNLSISKTALQSLEGLEKLETIEGDLVIIYNKSIENINGLEGLRNVEDLFVGYNDVLTGLDGLINLASLKGTFLEIIGNPELATLSGLDNIMDITGSSYVTVRIRDNATLTNFCAITPLVVELSSLGFSYEVSGNAYNPLQSDLSAGNCSM